MAEIPETRCDETADGVPIADQVVSDGPLELVAVLGYVSHVDRVKIRAGPHTGEIEMQARDVGGIGVHIASRIESLAAANEVLVPRTVTDLVAASGITFADRGLHDLKGIPGSWQLLAVLDA